jgi:hypothetical protein
MTQVVESSYPQCVDSNDFWEIRERIEASLFGAAESAVSAGPQLSDPDSNASRGQRVEDLAEALSELTSLAGRENVVDELRGLAEEYKTVDRDVEPYDYDDSQRVMPASSAPFDVRALFSDL